MLQSQATSYPQRHSRPCPPAHGLHSFPALLQQPNLHSRPQAPSCGKQAARPYRARSTVVQAIHIDRRHHLELSWKRQQEREERLKQEAVMGSVIEIQDLEHLESVVDKSGSCLVVLFCYTRSCGVCKGLLAEFQALCEEAKAQQVRAVFARHNLLNEFDHWSDVSVWHGVRVVPTIFFFDGGALVKKVTLHDVRRMGEAASSIQQAMQQDLRHMKSMFRQMIFQTAPGSRP